MPGVSYRGASPPLQPGKEVLRQTLARHVHVLARDIGPRHAGQLENLDRAADYIANSFSAAGFVVNRSRYAARGKQFENIEVEIAGVSSRREIVVVGAHYDSVAYSPGANDNGTGVAALLELARMNRTRRFDRTLRFVAFTNEEYPLGGTADMGSEVYATQARSRGEKIVAMMALETIGYYTNVPGSQRYPWPLAWFYPKTGNFVAFVGNVYFRSLVTESIHAFRRHAVLPSEGGALPELFSDITRSDHNSFWRQGYPAFMITDTAPFRYPHYHSPHDTPDKIDFVRLTHLVLGLRHVIDQLALSRV